MLRSEVHKFCRDLNELKTNICGKATEVVAITTMKGQATG